MRLRNLVVWVTLLAMTGCGVGLSGCALARLPNVGATLSGDKAQPDVLGPFAGDGPVSSLQDWQTRRVPVLQAAFADQIYGAMPLPAPVSIASRQILAQPTTGSIGMIERISVRIDVQARNAWPSGAPIVDMILVTPRGAGPFPVLAGGTFCSNEAAFPKLAGTRTANLPLPKECGGSIPPFVVEAIFGRAANTPPLEDITKAGFAVAMWHPGDVVPDNADTATPYLTALTPIGTSPENRTGAIAAWAWTLSRMTDVLVQDPRLDAKRISFIGHSRHGKAALLAATYDKRAAAAWALQSGTAGAALGLDEVGEPIEAITKGFPHWFSPAYARFTARQNDVSVDQHQLIAMIAPRPVLIGTGRRDQWGDPHGSYRALVGASPVYELYGASPFVQPDLKVAATTGPLAFYMRGGLHGIHSEDWREALAFFKARDPHLP
jgi:hypothetical protein